MQSNQSPEEGSEEISSILLQLPATKRQIKEDEQMYRLDLMKAENQYLENLHAEQKKNLDELIKSVDHNERQIFLKNEFLKLENYVEYLRQDLITIKEQYNSQKGKLSSIQKQDEEVTRLLKVVNEKKKRNEKIHAEREEKLQTLTEIRSQKEAIANDISQIENYLSEERIKKIHFDKIQAEFKSIQDKILEKKNIIEEMKKKQIKSIELKMEKSQENEKKKETKRSQIEKLKLKIDRSKKKAKHVKELEIILQNFDEKEKSKLDDRQRRQNEQNAEFDKENERLRNLEEQFRISEREHEDFCKLKSLNFISFKDLNISEIQEHVANLERNIREKESELAKVEENLEKSRKDHEEELQSKKKKIEETETSLEVKKQKLNVDRNILLELNQKVIESRKKLDVQIQEKQEIATRKENEFFKRTETGNKILELKKTIVEEEKKLSLIEEMNRDALEISKDIQEALKYKEDLAKEEEQFRKAANEKLLIIEKRVLEKASNHRDKTMALEAQIQQDAKLLAQKKREVKKRDNKDMQKERELREKLAKINGEIFKFEKMEKESESKFEKEKVVFSLKEKSDNLKSILKSPVAKPVVLEPKSPRKVTFEVESDDSFSLSQIPLTQMPRSP